MLSDEQKELIDEYGESPSYHCVECCAPDLNPNNHIQCFKGLYLEEVICRTCWDLLDWEEKEFYAGEFDEVLEF